MEQPPPKNPRVPVNLRIKFRSETVEQFVERYAIDVSRGGIFIRTREPLAVGTQLKFDFQLQDTTPLMAGEGTVVWIREHDPTRAGVTPGMGVRFDKLTPASIPVLERILLDKLKREPSGPNAATVSGKSGASPLPARRPSSTFSALDPGLSASAPTSPVAKPTLPLAPLVPAKGPGNSGSLPTLESQSTLGRLATGPNLSAFAPVAPGTKSPVPVLSKPGIVNATVTGTVTGTASTPATGDSSGTPAVPTAVEDSERTQIADGLPDFSNEPTHVGGQALVLAELAAARGPSSTAPSRRTLTPALEAGAATGAAPSPILAPEATAARTTSPDGTTHAETPPAASPPGPLESDLARTVPAEARMNAITSAMRSTTPPANPRPPEKKRPLALIALGAVVVVAAAAAVVIHMSNRGDGQVSPPVASAPAPAITPAPPPPPPAPAPAPPAPINAAPEGTPPPAAATNPGGEPGPGEGAVAPAKPAEGKPAEAAGTEANPGEAKPAEAPAVAEAGPVPLKPGRKPRPLPRRKGATASKAEAALDAPAAAGDEGGATDAPAGNVARIISLPVGAEVLIDGQSMGKTPFTGKDIDPAAPHALTVRKEGFETYEHMLSPSDWIKGKGNSQNLKVTLKLPRARASGEPEGAAAKKVDKKIDKAGEPGSSEPAKTEAPPAAPTP
jgi:uncharacterized protein (TIGR02266 family)